MQLALAAIIPLFLFFINSRLPSTAAQAVCSNGAVRLTGGPSQLAGRLEVCFSNQWGSVCAGAEHPWTNNNAAVICNQLGYSTKGAVAPSNGYYGAGSGSIHLSNVSCTGDEQRLTDCSTSLVGQHSPSCTHDQDVAVVCQEKHFSCKDGEVRLMGGSAGNEGRIEVCFNNQYGTVCDDYWDKHDATVVCRQLGYSDKGAIAVHKAAFGPGYGPVYLDDLQCDGEEPHISQCGHNGVSDSNCHHNEDAGVICKPAGDPAVCEDGEVRLVNGRLASEGRVEVCYNGVWGTVCHDLWDDDNAAVVCSQLGYPATGAKAIKYADFGEGSGVIFLDSVKCSGAEKFLNECASDPLAVHNCGHSKDAGVICADPLSTCVDGEVRLADGSQGNAGRVEVCYDNHYGTVCEDDWSTDDANVVCSQLGFEKFGAIAVKGGYYGDGVGMIYLDNLQCAGDESDLFKCGHNGVGKSNCFHHQDAAVICKEKIPAKSSCTNGDVRLVGGAVDSEGAVEVCVNGVWSGVCGTGWDQGDAQVVCGQLGFPSNNIKSIAVPGGHYSESGVPTLLSNVSCDGSEGNILNCGNTLPQDLGSTHCSTGMAAAGVICSASNPACEDGDIRLVGGVSANQGRVEICYNGVWGTVCGREEWSQEEAAVVCNQLGYDLEETRPVPVAGGSFGTGTGPVFLSGIHCYGNEKALKECIGADFDYQSCPHSLDMGVVCAAYPCVDGETRLIGGSHGNEGRLEVCTNGAWKAVCIDSLSSAHVEEICSTIAGPNTQGSYGVAGLFAGVASNVGGAISGSLHSCSSGDILQCIRQTFKDDSTTCGRHNSIGIICSGNSVCKSGDVRLMGGASEDEGRVEVCLGNEWGTVCDDSWDDKSASVVCNQLGFDTADYTDGMVMAIPGGYYGNGEGDIFIDNVRCGGSEDNLLQCLVTGVKNHNCQHKEDAGVKCRARQTSLVPNPSTASINRVGGTSTVAIGNGPTPTDVGDVGLNAANEGEEPAMSSSSGIGLSSDIIVPIAAMATVIAIIMCFTIIAILVFKWRRLKLLMSSGDVPAAENKLSSSPTHTSTVDVPLPV